MPIDTHAILQQIDEAVSEWKDLRSRSKHDVVRINLTMKSLQLKSVLRARLTDSRQRPVITRVVYRKYWRAKPILVHFAKARRGYFCAKAGI